MTPYSHLYSAGVDCCTMDPAALAQAERSWLCSGCRQPRPATAGVDVVIQEAPARGRPMSLVFDCGVGLARRDLLDCLGEAASRELYLGAVYVDDGSELSEWATIRGRRRLILRGSKQVSHGPCRVCGQMLYYAAGARYLYPAPEPGVSVFESHLWGLVVTAEVMQRVDRKRWRGLAVEGLKVATVPRDGLGELR